jgi:dienelactone hydrolase
VIAPQAIPKQRAGAAVSTWDGRDADRAFLLAVWDDAWRKHPMIDPSRVVVAGYSSGGRAASLLVAHRRAQISAAIFHATPASVDEETLIGKHVFLIAGERDSGFSAAKAGARRDALLRRGVDVTLFVAPGETHATVYDNVREAAAWMLNGFKNPGTTKP